MCKEKSAPQGTQSPPHNQVEYLETGDDSTDSELEQTTFTINAVTKGSGSRIMLEPKVDGVLLPMELDSVSIISQETVKKLLSKSQVKESDVILKTYSGEQCSLQKFLIGGCT